MISSKVDVWSIGVIFYYMLYGQKPFGNSMKADEFKKDTLRLTKTLDFPPGKNVSQKSIDFIKACLTQQVNQRPDIFQALEKFHDN